MFDIRARYANATGWQTVSMNGPCQEEAIKEAIEYLSEWDDNRRLRFDWVVVTDTDESDPLDAIVFQAGTTFG